MPPGYCPLAGNPVDGDQVASKSSATGTVSRNAGAGSKDLTAAVDTAAPRYSLKSQNPVVFVAGLQVWLNEHCGIVSDS